MKRANLLLIASICLPLLACGSSPPTHFFALDQLPTTRAKSTKGNVIIQVVSVHIPALLDRQEMVRQEDSHLEVSDENRWGAPLDEMLQRVLTQDLAARLAPGEVRFPQEPTNSSVDELVLDVLEFDADNSGTVKFEGSWSLMKKDTPTPFLTRHVQLSETGPKDFAGQAGTMSRIVAQLSDQIIKSL